MAAAAPAARKIKTLFSPKTPPQRRSMTDDDSAFGYETPRTVGGVRTAMQYISLQMMVGTAVGTTPFPRATLQKDMLAQWFKVTHFQNAVGNVREVILPPFAHVTGIVCNSRSTGMYVLFYLVQIHVVCIAINAPRESVCLRTSCPGLACLSLWTCLPNCHFNFVPLTKPPWSCWAAGKCELSTGLAGCTSSQSNISENVCCVM
jgi:hypothetical protein